MVNPERTTAVLEQGRRERLHIGAQVFASIGGVACVDLALGEARSGAALTPDSLMLWMSSVKPVAAAAVLQLRERGLLQLDDPTNAQNHRAARRFLAADTPREKLYHGLHGLTDYTE